MAYTNNIPTATATPSSEQQLITDNFAELDTCLSVNHVALNDANQGKHKHVTFPEQSSNPSTAADETAIFSKLSALSAETELFIRKEGDGTVYEFTSSGAAQVGWTRLPSGILIKWAGGLITAASGLTTYTWPTGATIPAFTNVFTALVSPRGSGNEDKAVFLNSIATTYVTLYGTYRTTTTVRQVNYEVVVIGI